MDISEFRKRARKFLDESEAEIGTREPWWYSAKLSEEAGEAAKAFNRLTGLSRKKGTIKELKRELGDTIYCSFILAEKLEIDLTDSLDENYDDVMSRGFSEK